MCTGAVPARDRAGVANAPCMKPNQPDRPRTFTGRGRARQTSRSVRIADRVAKVLIMIGGLGTIAAVSLVCVFLIWVLLPLFGGATVTEAASAPLTGTDAQARRFAVDEYRTIAWRLEPDGRLQVLATADGALIEEQRPFADYDVTAWAFSPTGPEFVIGLADGKVVQGTIGFETGSPDEADLPPPIRALPVGGRARWKDGIVEHAAAGRFRLQTVAVALGEPIDLGAQAPIELVDFTTLANGTAFAVYTRNGDLLVKDVVERVNLLEQTTVRTVRGGRVALGRDAAGVPAHLRLGSNGTIGYLAWKTGRLLRLDLRDTEAPAFAERIDLLADRPGAELTAFMFLIGETTLLAGDSTGRTSAWFPINTTKDTTVDALQLIKAHELPGPGAAVTAFGVSARSRVFAAGYADGSIRIYQATSEKEIGELQTERKEPVAAVLVTPKEDAIAALVGRELWAWSLDIGHPESTFASLFRPVWYEGQAEPEHVWQSSSGTDSFEPKFGLFPLIFGTLKATVFALLFGVPLALLGAIYTSEFMDHRTRARIKPTIELMASLPSVVLGFVAALVFAPFIEQHIASLIACFVTVPFVFILGGYLWQLLPQRIALGYVRFRFWFVLLALLLGVGLGWGVGPRMQQLLFVGDGNAGFIDWLNNQESGSAAPGWFLILLPLAAFATMFVMGRVGQPKRGPASHPGLRELGRLATGVVCTLGIAALLSLLLSAAGLDVRGGLFDTYVQRNAFVVGLVMGFAVIPIIYTISEDALTAVPEHLRAASLGAGATQWQTAMRIIIPTAMSGLFSAVMIGLGRAVGETMIVLMAAGNTPVLEWNIFNGFRTLSANIAVELPEAVQNSTHYRLLFLAGLVLFAMTFVVNTFAEVVRQRFRRRAYQL